MFKKKKREEFGLGDGLPYTETARNVPREEINK